MVRRSERLGIPGRRIIPSSVSHHTQQSFAFLTSSNTQESRTTVRQWFRAVCFSFPFPTFQINASEVFQMPQGLFNQHSVHEEIKYKFGTHVSVRWHTLGSCKFNDSTSTRTLAPKTSTKTAKRPFTMATADEFGTSSRLFHSCNSVNRHKTVPRWKDNPLLRNFFWF